MKFDKYYSTGDYGYNEYKTILPFFGFQYKSDTYTHYHTHGGDIRITHEYGNTYKVEKTREYESTSYSKIDTYTRSYTPSLEELSIEHRFLEALSKVYIQFYVRNVKRIPILHMRGFLTFPITLWETPYIEPTLEVFHKRRGGINLLSSVMSNIGKSMLKHSIWFWVIIAMIYYEGLNLPLSDASPYICLFFTPVLSMIMIGTSMLISSITKRSKKPLKQMSLRYTEKLRKRYYRRMRYIYGRKLGALLKEYSILKDKYKDNIFRM